MKTTIEKAVIVDLVITEYDSLVRYLRHDKQSMIVFFENMRKIGNEYKKEFVSIKMRKNADIKEALKDYKIKEYFIFECGERNYKIFYTKTDGSFIYQLAFLRLP